jgi:precorrin-3B methylase
MITRNSRKHREEITIDELKSFRNVFDANKMIYLIVGDAETQLKNC